MRSAECGVQYLCPTSGLVIGIWSLELSDLRRSDTVKSTTTWSLPGMLAVAVLLTAPALAVGDDLIGHWKLDEQAGGTAADSSGKTRNGQVHGAAWTEGTIGGALKFDGQNDYLELGDLGEFESITIAFWMKPEDVTKADRWQGLVSSDGWEEGVFHIPLRGRAVDVYLHAGESRRGRLSSSKLDAGVWYHVAVVADTKQHAIQLFINGFEDDVDDISALSTKIKLTGQVVGRESNGRYFQGSIDDVRIYNRALAAQEIKALCPDAPAPAARDRRNIRTGYRIPDEGYCDQPYTVITKDGNWLCTLTTGPGHEGNLGQHIVSTISSDRGKTWSKLIDIEPSEEREASWVMPLITPSGRVYVFYTYNAENVHTLDGKRIRADTLGWYAYKYSDDNGRTWSQERYRLPLRMTAADHENQFQGKVQCFWGIGKPIVSGKTAFLAFSKVRKLVVDDSEGWFFRSDNILSEPDPNKIQWQMLPDGDRGLRAPEMGDVQAEQNLVALSDGSLYCMYRTKNGYPCHAYSRDGGHTWTKPVYATYTPGGRKMKTPRACPRIWRARNGKFLFWYHLHSEITRNGFSGRNPAWITGGVEKDGSIHWSQPEILLYDPNPSIRTSYPDLIEQDGDYFITETQKSIARVHQIDASLLEGLWNQGREKTVARNGLVLELASEQLKAPEAVLSKHLDVEKTGGLSLDFWIALDDLSAGQVVLDSRTPAGNGIVLTTAEKGALAVELSDGKAKAAWTCDSGLLQPGKLHHVAVIVDAGPRIISFVVDGVLCDGGDTRTHGWGRYTKPLGDVSGTGTLRLAPAVRGRFKSLRVYERYLRTSEAIANYHAGL